MNPDNEEIKVIEDLSYIEEEAIEARNRINKSLEEGNMNFSIGTLKRLYIGGNDEDKLLAQNLLKKQIESDPEIHSVIYSYISGRGDKSRQKRNFNGFTREKTVYPKVDEVCDIILNEWKAALSAINEDMANNKGKGR